jgi:large subunit ribosomal protein L4e
MTSVPLISVYTADDSNKVLPKHVALPSVFRTPIRPDIVHFVHSNLAKNRRQGKKIIL